MGRAIAGLTFLAFILTSIVSYFTHVIHSFLAIFESPDAFKAVVVLVLGAIIPFVGMIHGIMIWLGQGLLF